MEEEQNTNEVKDQTPGVPVPEPKKAEEAAEAPADDEEDEEESEESEKNTVCKQYGV